MSIAGALGFALLQLFHPRILWLMVWPVLIAVALWGAVLFVFWAQAAAAIGDILRVWIEKATFFVSWDATTAAVILAKVLIVILVVPLIQLTALLILGAFGMQEMVRHVAAVRFPSLARRGAGTSRQVAGSVWNGVVAVAGMLVLFLVTAPLWLVPPLWPLLAPAILGWVNQRVLRYDAIAEHATPDEMREVFAERKGSLYLLGLILAFSSYIPIAGWFAPVLFGMAFTHLLLAELERRRGAPIEGRVIAEGVEVLPPGTP